ncbi:MAG: methyltransferase domain-containing protein [Bacillus sp. (in: Bacteria)]|nr:methyltransferase domain-containing protein [Bacillus sp. (in: firmicutes)]MCM1426384.1 methyltransferase domain-containing protein [Eubacterium sp.]
MDSKSFDSRRIAEGYRERPWLHKQVMERIKKDCGITNSFKNGLDVGCGAGLSTKGLKLICEKVTGTDISPEMINICKQLYHDKAYCFYVAKAEETILPEEKYDIMTAAGVINWVDREKFLHNAGQVIKENGLMVIYDFWITDGMRGNEEYTEWYQKQYLPKFPKPPRKEDIWKQEDLSHGFVMEKQISYEMEYDFALDDFIAFMMIQSNVNVKIENGELTEEDVRLWMKRTLRDIFAGRRQTLIFFGYNWYIRK